MASQNLTSLELPARAPACRADSECFSQALARVRGEIRGLWLGVDYDFERASPARMRRFVKLLTGSIHTSSCILSLYASRARAERILAAFARTARAIRHPDNNLDVYLVFADIFVRALARNDGEIMLTFQSAATDEHFDSDEYPDYEAFAHLEDPFSLFVTASDIAERAFAVAAGYRVEDLCALLRDVFVSSNNWPLESPSLSIYTGAFLKAAHVVFDRPHAGVTDVTDPRAQALIACLLAKFQPSGVVYDLTEDLDPRWLDSYQTYPNAMSVTLHDAEPSATLRAAATLARPLEQAAARDRLRAWLEAQGFEPRLCALA